MKLPVSRRKRALRWLRRLDEHRQAAEKGNTEKFETADLKDYVWRSPLGEGFGD